MNIFSIGYEKYDYNFECISFLLFNKVFEKKKVMKITFYELFRCLQSTGLNCF